MITSDRDVFVGAHVTLETKETLRQEALLSNRSMSLIVSEAIDEWLAKHGATEPVRSNKRQSTEEDVPLPFSE